MTSTADFIDEEGARLKRAPFVAGMAISLADPRRPDRGAGPERWVSRRSTKPREHE